jgi:hypothetical protein
MRARFVKEETMDWTVDQNNGHQADLSRGTETKEIRRPKAMIPDDFITTLRPGSLLDDTTLLVYFSKD